MNLNVEFLVKSNTASGKKLIKIKSLVVRKVKQELVCDVVYCCEKTLERNLGGKKKILEDLGGDPRYI